MSAAPKLEPRRMDNSHLSVLELANRRMRWLDRRQQVLAQNVANVDTPGFVARDLRAFADVLADGTGASPASSHVRHMPGTRDPNIALATVAAHGPNGNAVGLEDQLIQVADTESAQATAVNIFRKYLALFRLALGRAQ